MRSSLFFLVKKSQKCDTKKGLRGVIPKDKVSETEARTNERSNDLAEEKNLSQIQKDVAEYSWLDLVTLVSNLSAKVSELTTEITLLKASHITSANNTVQRIQELEELQPITRSQASAIRKAIGKE